jgi:hypothetical protein
MEEHVGQVPPPGGGHHQHRRRGIRREGAPDGHVHKQDAQHGVFQARADGLAVDAITQEHGGQGHGGRLSDEGAHQRHGRQQHEGRSQMPRQGDQAGEGTGELPGHLNDWFAGRRHHDGKHKQGLGEVARVQVVGRGLFAFQAEHTEHQHQGPKAKHHLDLTHQVPQACMSGAGVGQVFEELGRKSVDQGQAKQRRADHLDGAWVHALDAISHALFLPMASGCGWPHALSFGPC